MRAFTACFIAVLGFGGLTTVAACSDSTDASGGAGGGAGEAGETSVAGSAGKPAAGDAGSTGEAGATSTVCGFQTEACNDCLTDSCGDTLGACANDATCAPELADLPTCACDKTKTAESCQNAFVTGGGAKALALATCYQTNCVEACQ